jgi:hypothetical protein
MQNTTDSYLRKETNQAEQVLAHKANKTDKVEVSDARLLGDDYYDNFSLTVDYTRDLENLLSDAGFNRHSYDKDRINHRQFSMSDRLNGTMSEVQCRVFGFRYKMRRSEAIKEMAKSDFCPANLFELIALKKAYPNITKRFPQVAALGSISRITEQFDGHLARFVPVLYTQYDPFILDTFNFWQYEFDYDYHFLAVRRTKKIKKKFLFWHF